MAPRIQHFPVPAGNVMRVHCNIDPNDGVSLFDADDIRWRVYEQTLGIPTLGVDPLIEKSLDHGIQIEDPVLLKFYIDLEEADTVELLRNYYHEGTVIALGGLPVTVVYGIMTVTQSENR